MRLTWITRQEIPNQLTESTERRKGVEVSAKQKWSFYPSLSPVSQNNSNTNRRIKPDQCLLPSIFRFNYKKSCGVYLLYLCYSDTCWLAEVVIIEKLFQKELLKFRLFFSASSNCPGSAIRSNSLLAWM